MAAFSKDRVTEELSRFVDPGTGGIVVSEEGAVIRFLLKRNGESVEVSITDLDRPILLQSGADKVQFANYKALLASERFGDLKSWANRQLDVLESRGQPIDNLIDPVGELRPSGERVDSFGSVFHSLKQLEGSGSPVCVFLIDGPAGVGKTNLIEQVARKAASEFNFSGSRLVLHVSSRGKVLSNIEDLMAYSLQSLRLQVTFDQVPVLVRHGLVTLAIDGFDELGDPEGYNHAWGQLNDLIEYVKGCGSLILAGRETFIGRDRLLKSVKGLSVGSEVVELYLEETPRSLAEEWLRKQGLGQQSITLLSDGGLLDRGSFALRPFFLAYLAKVIESDVDLEGEVLRQGDILPLVVNGMIDREVRRFDGDISAALGGAEGVREYLRRLLSEAAREMAGDESESISESMLTWIVDLAVPVGLDAKVVGALKARAAAVAFLALDDRAGYRRFAHSQFFGYFLSNSTLDSLAEGDVPKWLRRGVAGPDFLSAFVPFLRSASVESPVVVAKFMAQLTAVSGKVESSAEGVQIKRNIGALRFSTLCISTAAAPVEVSAEEIQHGFAGTGTFSARVKVGYFGALDVRSCDFSAVEFHGGEIGTLIVDRGSRIGSKFPSVLSVRTYGADGRAQEIFDPAAVSEIVSRVGPRPESNGDEEDSSALKLLDKLCRSRRYWFRPENDDLFGPFDSLEGWAELRLALDSADMIRVDDQRQVSGTKSEWIHIKNTRGILLRDTSDEKVSKLLAALGG